MSAIGPSNAPQTALAPPLTTPPRTRVLGWMTLALLLAPVVALIATAFALWQGLHTEAGTRWWLAQVARQVPGVEIDTPRGALLGADAQFELDRLVLGLGRNTLRIDGLRIGGLQAQGWRASAPYVRLAAATVSAQRVGLATQPDPAPTPATPPRALVLPVTLRIEALRIDAFDAPGLAAPVEAIAGRLDLAEAQHRLDGFSARWRGLVATGQAQLDTTGTLALAASASLRADPKTEDAALPAWARKLTLDAKAAGPLARFDVQALLGLHDQRLDARVQVTPFDALPVSQLEARFAKLDLARLGDVLGQGASLPATALDGDVLLQLDTREPLVVRARARNATPGRWDRHRLPVAELDLLARGRGSAWAIERGELRLAGDEGAAAGSVQATGRFDAAEAALELHLRDVLLRALDERAPPLRLAGPLKLRHQPPTGPAVGGGLGRLRVEAELEGAQVASAGVAARRGHAPKPAAAAALREPVRLTLQATADVPASRYVVDKLQARSAGARLEGQGRAERAGDTWQAQAAVTLADFDPALWLPGDPTAAWRRAPNRLQGDLKLDVRVPATLPASRGVPADAPAAPTLRWLAAATGRLDARLADGSVFTGQPLSLQAQAEADGRGALTARADALAVGNRARLDLALALAGSTVQDAQRKAERVQLDIDAPALDKLAPLAQSLGLGKLAGRLQAQASADGPLGAWLAGRASAPLRTRGEAKVQSVEAGGVTVATAEGRWDLTLPGRDGLGTQAAADPKLDARIDLRELRAAGLALPQATLNLSGSLAAHRAQVQASLLPRTSAAKNGEAATKATNATNGSANSGAAGSATGGATGAGPLELVLDLEGRWQALPAPVGNAAGGGWQWRGRWNELSLRPAGAARATTAAPLLEARGLDVEFIDGPSGMRFAAAPGRIAIVGGALRWSRAEWSRTAPAAGAAARDRLDLEAEIEPLRVAPLMQRLQPDFGWGGDLLVAGRATVRSEPVLAAHVEIARQSGDLTVQEFDTVQRLGLNALRFDLNVESGVWAATQVIDGETLGRVAGAQTVRSAGVDHGLLPAADAPVEGAIRLQVDNLSTWGAWVPAGWRLGGALDGVLKIGGRFGAPELTGELSGRQLALRNALEGVAWSEGELRARFEGETARLETLSFRAGEGRLEARGDARLGATPQTNLRVTAERATVLGRVDRRVVASGEARLAIDPQTIKLDGELRAEEGLIDISRGDAPKLGDDVRVRRTATTPGEADAAAPAPVAPRSTEMRLAIDLGERFRLRGRGIDTRLEGRLQLTSPKGKLAAAGEIRTDRGTYEAYGQKLEIERGVVTFVGDLANPRLDIVAVRANTDTRVGVLVSGSAQSPRVRLFSDPEMPSTDKLALLVTGRSYDSLGGTETLLLQQAALALLAGDGGDGNNFDVARLLQLDQLSVRQSDGTVRDTVVTLGKQISDRVYVGYERGLNAAAGNWQLIYRVARRFTLRAQSGDDPAVDLIWVFRW